MCIYKSIVYCCSATPRKRRLSSSGSLFSTQESRVTRIEAFIYFPYFQNNIFRWAILLFTRIFIFFVKLKSEKRKQERSFNRLIISQKPLTDGVTILACVNPPTFFLTSYSYQLFATRAVSALLVEETLNKVCQAGLMYFVRKELYFGISHLNGF